MARNSDESLPLQECQPIISQGYFRTKYDNPSTWVDWHRPGALAFLKMKCSETNEAGIPYNDELDENLPVHKINYDGKQKLSQPPASDIQIMWIGHATLLVQFDGITILTDPVFLNRCSPVRFAGPKRYRPIPCDIEDLPHVTAVVISHNHYDHLEWDAVVKLNHFHKDIRWFVPKGLKDWFTDCKNVIELAWWEESVMNLNDKDDTKVICVPAQHWSQRKLHDAMTSLWCGWVIKGKTHTFYYSGDTGYCPVFKQIGDKFGPMDLSAIPIGCYSPRNFMKPQHIDPYEAVIIHKEVKSKRSVGIHWGTFDGLGSHEPYLEPRDLLRNAVEKNELTEEDFFTVDHGEIKILKSGYSEERNQQYSKTDTSHKQDNKL